MSGQPPIPPHIAKLTGPIFLGEIFNWGLFGALSVQTYVYYLAFPNDRWIPKGIVAAVYILELLQTVLSTKDGFIYFGSGWGNTIAFNQVGLLWFSIPVMTSLLSSMIQFFFAWRIWIISRSRYVPTIICIMSLTQLVGGLWAGINAAEIGEWSHLQEENQAPTIIWLGGMCPFFTVTTKSNTETPLSKKGTAACDVLITTAMFYCLTTSRNGFRATNAILVKFIRLTVETGLISSTFAILDLTFFLVFKHDNYHLIPATCLSKFYSNSLLVLLNARIRIWNGHNVSSTTTDETLSWTPTKSVLQQQQSSQPSATYHLANVASNRNPRILDISVTTTTHTTTEVPIKHGPFNGASHDEDDHGLKTLPHVHRRSLHPAESVKGGVKVITRHTASPGYKLRVSSDERDLNMKFQARVVFASLLYGAGVYSQTGLAPKQFLTLPLGQVRPSGWLFDQLMLQTNGLAGHEHEFYHYISETDWLGGDALYSNLEEAGSYWFNGIVPNAILANSTELKQKISEFLDYVLSHQDSTGWFGPEVGTDKERFLWGRYPFMFGAIQMVEATPDLTDRVVTALYKFVQLANTMLHNNAQGVEEWGQARWHDFVITLQWLYDFHPNGNEDLLMDTMHMLRSTGLPWEVMFSPEVFIKTPTGGPDDNPPLGYIRAWHGVNVAEAFKALPATYRFTHNQSGQYLDRASEGWDLVFQYHGRPSGIFAADEYLAGLEAARGTELCEVVETMFSGSYLYQVIGDPKYLDRVERIAYNALPATLTGDFWSRQYLQQQNQIAAQNMDPNPFPNDGPYSNVFGTEPNYPCCTVNHPQGWPKFISNAFLTTPDQNSLVQAYLGPFTTSASLANDNDVFVTVDTIYPFSDTLTTTITATQDFTYFVRIPSWVKDGTISMNGGEAQALSPDPKGLQAVQISAGTTKFVLELPAEITTESRPHGSVALHRGPLHYAFDIPRNSTVIAQNAQEPRAVDLQFEAIVSWQYAIDPSTVQFVNDPPSSGTLPSPVFDSNLPPLSIEVTACPIEWSVAGNTFASAPPENPACTGAQKTIRLTPFGSTKLRISEFPVFKAI
ncbi:hypothetical protein D9758_011159 [Tetrapyrgos nigripes]|uniref:Uncharacterized protein n=1 Tax=Tetrapyrgos nigripes TaxID=182062 RepID=A0A8H5CLW6_9AGAR|nr:hypothetical protein D9758_011159 [Tetrapyrgos nigripes]